ncbi:hypothetical protein [Metabacillus bambusae]|uniref:Uncharacterized protein n=1 Tax=Metabacillus bambusae TaxID=2795218 RepID=A0ABS3MZP5_9BACI|nr:hypothetical protein [Metabacillus bambusae]MBO1511369.1 hypothetical protein [Metabacillus bambusae]
MRFLIEYKDFSTKEEINKSLSILDTFLNEHLIGDFHGQTFESILIRFINNAPPKKKFKLKSLYKIIAEVEIKGNFTNNMKLNITDFQHGLLKVIDVINMVSQIEVKEEMDFNKDKLLNSINTIISKAPQTNEELKSYAKKENKIKYVNTVKRVDSLIYFSKINRRPLLKRIIGVRLYDHFEKNTLAPYDYIYSQLFSNLLRRAEVKSPDYEEIYFSIGETMEQAKQSIAIDEFFKYTYSTLNLSEYNQADDKGKANMVFHSMCEGLRMIADFDHLELEKIESVIEYIDKNGIDIELIYSTAQNNNYLAEVMYKVPQSYLTKAEFKLRLTDFKTNSTGIRTIDKLDIYYAPYSIGKIQLKKNEIVIKGRNSLRAEVSREIDKLPSEYRFNINEILYGHDT